MGASQTAILPELDGVTSTWKVVELDAAGSNTIFGCDSINQSKRILLY